MKSVLLLNAEGVQTLCLARSLRKQGHHVVGFCNHKMTSGYTTRWLNERFKSPDISLYQADFKTFLYHYLREHHIDIIIPLADDGADFLSRNKEDIEKSFHSKCAIPNYHFFNAINNKQKLMELCEFYHFSHPLTKALPHDFEDTSKVKKELDEIAQYIGFPALIKPDLSQGAKGIMRVENMQELQKKLLEVNKMFGSCTLQQYVEQPDYYYNVMLYRDKQGNMDNYTIIKIRRFFPIKGGSSCYCETVAHQPLLEQCKDVLNKMQWHGFADFDILEDKHTHELKIIEINPRVPSSFQAAFAANIDFGKVIMADEFDEPMPKFGYKTGMQVRWLGLDVMWFLFSQKRFSFRPSWFKFLGRNLSYQDGSWNDPLPMLAGMLAGVVKYMNPQFRKSKLKS